MKRGRPPKPNRVALNMRKYRARLRRGVMIYPVPLGCDELEAMVRWDWMTRDQQGDRARVGEVIAIQLAKAFRHY